MLHEPHRINTSHGAGRHLDEKRLEGSSNRRFFGLVSGLFLFCATWRAITPTVPHHGHHADVSEMDVAGKTAETAESCENAQKERGTEGGALLKYGDLPRKRPPVGRNIDQSPLIGRLLRHTHTDPYIVL